MKRVENHNRYSVFFYTPTHTHTEQVQVSMTLRGTKFLATNEIIGGRLCGIYGGYMLCRRVSDSVSNRREWMGGGP